MNTAPLNLVISEDPLLSQEACDQIIQQAKNSGVEQRNIVEVTDKFNWADVFAESASLSLFSEIKLTDIRFAKSPNKEAQNALVELATAASLENQFLIRLPKMEKRQKSTKWFKALSQAAKVQELWPPRPNEYLGWVTQRANKHQLNLAQEALQVIAEQTEGNLLAANQLIEKLSLLYAQDAVSLDQVSALISDNAKYSVFLCLDEALSGKGERAVRMLKKFKIEGVAPISIMVNLSREIGLCLQVSTAVSQGLPAAQALSKSFLWETKKRLIINAAQRLPLVMWQRLMVRCAFLDRMIKGQESGDIWQELESCLWAVSGLKVWRAK